MNNISSPVSKQRVNAPKVGGARNATEDEFVMHSVPRCLDIQGETPRGVGLSGAQNRRRPKPPWQATARGLPLWSSSVGVWGHWMDGWIVVSNHYHLKNTENGITLYPDLSLRAGCVLIGFRTFSGRNMCLVFNVRNQSCKQSSLLDTIFNYMFYFGPPGTNL